MDPGGPLTRDAPGKETEEEQPHAAGGGGPTRGNLGVLRVLAVLAKRKDVSLFLLDQLSIGLAKVSSGLGWGGVGWAWWVGLVGVGGGSACSDVWLPARSMFPVVMNVQEGIWPTPPSVNIRC